MSPRTVHPLRAGAMGLLALALSASPGIAQAATFTNDYETLQSKFTSLADAMGADDYAWRPMEGVRSVSEVYMLIAAEAYYLPSFWDAPPPEGIEIGFEMFDTMAAVTDKPSVMRHLRAAFEYSASKVAALTDADMERRVQFFGRERSLGEAMYSLLADMHEHLGQAIAYARTNHVVPPWSAGGGD